MQIALGQTYFAKQLANDKTINSLFIVYPRFFDLKKELIKRNYRNYIYRIWLLRDKIEYAIYPDYVRYELTLPAHIKYIYVIHELEKDAKAFFSLNKKFRLIAGYASDERYRNYTLNEFLSYFSGVEKWYLGVSTKWEAKEAVLNGFEYMDITTMAIGSFSQLRGYESVKRLLLKFYNFVKREEKRVQTTIKLTEFLK